MARAKKKRDDCRGKGQCEVCQGTQREVQATGSVSARAPIRAAASPSKPLSGARRPRRRPLHRGAGVLYLPSCSPPACRCPLRIIGTPAIAEPSTWGGRLLAAAAAAVPFQGSGHCIVARHSCPLHDRASRSHSSDLSWEQQPHSSIFFFAGCGGPDPSCGTDVRAPSRGVPFP